MAQSMNPIELQKSLKGVDYPANKEQLQQAAKDNGANDEVMDFLEQIPEQDYETPAEVTKQMSEDKADSQESE